LFWNGLERLVLGRFGTFWTVFLADLTHWTADLTVCTVHFCISGTVFLADLTVCTVLDGFTSQFDAMDDELDGIRGRIFPERLTNWTAFGDEFFGDG